MDDLDKLANKFSGWAKGLFQSEDAKWKERGQGKRLGEGTAPKARPQSARPSAPPQSSSGGTSSSGAARAPQQQQAPAQTPPQPLATPAERRGPHLRNPPPGLTHMGSHAADTDVVQTAILNSVVMANTPTGAERAGLGPHLLNPTALSPAASTGLGEPAATPTAAGPLNTPTKAEMRQQGADMWAPEQAHLQAQLAQIASHDPKAASQSFTVLYKLLKNILDNPNQTKYRSVRISNPSIQSAVVSVPGAMEFLESCGFVTLFEPITNSVTPSSTSETGAVCKEAAKEGTGVGEGGSGQHGATHEEVPLEGFLTLPDGAPPAPLHTGLSALSAVLSSLGVTVTSPTNTASTSSATQGSKGTTSAATSAHTHTVTGGASGNSRPTAPPQEPIDRQTQVVLPVAPDTDVPDWVYERTGAELKAEVMALAKKRAEGQVLLTRAMRDKMSAAAEQVNATAANPSAPVRIRVRFPEGVCLQGSFGLREPVTRLFEWTTEALRFPDLSYELITPSRKPLGGSGLLRDHPDLTGAVVLNFRVLDTGVGRALAHNVPFLNDALLLRTRAE